MSKSPVTTITDDLLAEIEVEAGMATGGKWEAADSPVGEIYIEGECNEFITGAIDHVHDANYIALASPGTVVAIITELRALRAENAELNQRLTRVSGQLITTKTERDGRLAELQVAAKMNLNLLSLQSDAEKYRRLRDVPTDQLGEPRIPCVAIPDDKMSGVYVSGEDLDAAMQEQYQ